MFTMFFFFFSITYGSAKKPDDIKRSEEGEQISAGLTSSPFASKCQQSSYIKRIQIFLFAI